MANEQSAQVDSRFLKLSLVFFASLVIPSFYVYFAISPELKLYWFGIALVVSLISTIIIVLLPLNKKRFYMPSSALLSSILYNGYTVYVLHSQAL